MRNGDFAPAWEISDRVFSSPSRWRSPKAPRHQQLVWTREPLENRHVLVRCYHGLGDTIQFMRYLPVLRKIARRVTVWVQPTLVSLLSCMDGIDEILPLHDGSPDCSYDVDVEIMELSYVFRTTLKTIPSAVPYIHVTPTRVEGSGFKVGVVWRAGDWDRRRNIPFSLIRSLTAVAGVDFYALQQDAAVRERDSNLKFVLPSGGEVLTTAGIMAALDLVISIDSMPAHLAGALGIPTWTLLQKNADWRWMRDRQDSPWYPTMTLYRQRRPGEWHSVIRRVARDLRKIAGANQMNVRPSAHAGSPEPLRKFSHVL